MHVAWFLNPRFFESSRRNPNKEARISSVQGRSIRSSKPLAKHGGDESAFMCCGYGCGATAVTKKGLSSRVKMFDKNLVHAIIGGKDLDCGSAELSVNLGLTRGHGSLLPDLMILSRSEISATRPDFPIC